MTVKDIRKNILQPGVSKVTISSGGKSVTIERDDDGPTDPEAPIRKPSIPLKLDAPERRIYRAAIGMAKAAGERATADLLSLGLPAKFTPFLRSVILSALSDIGAGRVPPFMIDENKEGTISVVIRTNPVEAV